MSRDTEWKSAQGGHVVLARGGGRGGGGPCVWPQGRLSCRGCGRSSVGLGEGSSRAAVRCHWPGWLCGGGARRKGKLGRNGASPPFRR